MALRGYNEEEEGEVSAGGALTPKAADLSVEALSVANMPDPDYVRPMIDGVGDAEVRHAQAIVARQVSLQSLCAWRAGVIVQKRDRGVDFLAYLGGEPGHIPLGPRA